MALGVEGQVILQQSLVKLIGGAPKAVKALKKVSFSRQKKKDGNTAQKEKKKPSHSPNLGVCPGSLAFRDNVCNGRRVRVVARCDRNTPV